MQRYSDRRPLRRAADPPREAAAMEGFDPVTGLAGPVTFHKRAEEQWDKMTKKRKPLSVALFSIDRFKEYGEMTGKIAQVSVAQVIADNCKRRADFAGRVRDHKFAIVLSEVNVEGVRQLAEKICHEVEKQKLRPSYAGKVLTVSVGIATQVPRANRFFDSLMLNAVKGMQLAQKKGGNCVESGTE